MNADAEGLDEISRFGGIMPLTNNDRGGWRDLGGVWPSLFIELLRGNN